MRAEDVAIEIRAKAFLDHSHKGITREILAEVAGIILEGFREQMEKVVSSKPWFWRVIFRHGYAFAMEVLERLVESVRRDG